MASQNAGKRGRVEGRIILLSFSLFFSLFLSFSLSLHFPILLLLLGFSVSIFVLLHNAGRKVPFSCHPSLLRAVCNQHRFFPPEIINKTQTDQKPEQRVAINHPFIGLLFSWCPFAFPGAARFQNPPRDGVCSPFCLRRRRSDSWKLAIRRCQFLKMVFFFFFFCDSIPVV